MKRNLQMRHLWIATFLSSVAMTSVQNTHAKDVVSAAMVSPLKQVSQLITQGKYAQADVALKKLDAIANKTPYEHSLIDQLNLSLLIKQNKTDAALALYDHMLGSSYFSKEQKVKFALQQSSLAYRFKKYPDAIKSIQHYFQLGGDNAHMTTLLIQSYFLNQNYKEALDAQQKQIDAELKEGTVPAETQWQIMANCQDKLGDKEGLRHTYAQLATHYPNPQYWSKVMAALTTTKGMKPATELEIWQFRSDAGLLTTADQYITMAEVAIQAGYPWMARQILSNIHSKNLFKESDQKRVLRFESYVGKMIDQAKADYPAKLALAEKASSGDALFALGYDQFWAGKVTEGPNMMQKALTKTITDRNLALLQQAVAAKNMGGKVKAIQLLKSIKGKDVPAELAVLWLMKLQAK